MTSTVMGLEEPETYSRRLRWEASCSATLDSPLSSWDETQDNAILIIQMLAKYAWIKLPNLGRSKWKKGEQKLC